MGDKHSQTIFDCLHIWPFPIPGHNLVIVWSHCSQISKGLLYISVQNVQL